MSKAAAGGTFDRGLDDDVAAAVRRDIEETVGGVGGRVDRAHQAGRPRLRIVTRGDRDGEPGTESTER
jgi:hypothetical protein